MIFKNLHEEKILQNLENPRPIKILKTYWASLISKIQDCNEKLFIMGNISFFRESEKKFKNKVPIYSYDLQKIIPKINDSLKSDAKSGKIIIEGAEDPFYYPAIFKHQDGNYFYFTDEMAADYSFYLLGSDIQFSDSVITHHYILTLKKIFFMMSRTESQKSISILCSLQNFHNLYHEIIMRYEQTVRADRNGDKGRANAGHTKLDDKFMKNLKPGMTTQKITNLINNKFPNIAKGTKRRYIDKCKQHIENMKENNKGEDQLVN